MRWAAKSASAPPRGDRLDWLMTRQGQKRNLIVVCCVREAKKSDLVWPLHLHDDGMILVIARIELVPD